MGCNPSKNIKAAPTAKPFWSIQQISQELANSMMIKKYTFIKILGEGGVATTYLCKNTDGSEYAIQRIQKSCIGSELCAVLCSHFSVLQSIDNPYIVKFYELYEEADSLYIVMEYCSGTNLLERILSSSQLSEADASHIILMLLNAIQYLGSLGIVHCDIKPINVMIKGSGKLSEIKLIDFNLCKFKKEGYDENPNGTPQYLAPENVECVYSVASDMWSIGITLYILLSGEYPFWGENLKTLKERIKAGKLDFETEEWRAVSGDAKDLIRKLLNTDYKNRITAKEAMSHPWFQHASRYNHKTIRKVHDNFAHLYQQYKLFKAMTRIVSIYQWKSAFSKVKELLKQEDGSHKVFLSQSELIDMLQEMNHNATKEEIEEVLKQYNKHSSTKVNHQHKLSELESIEFHLHSSKDIETSNMLI